MSPRTLVTLGMFIIDTFRYEDSDGSDDSQRIMMSAEHAIGGGGTYCAVGARIWLPPSEIGMIIDRGHDFPSRMQNALDSYGHDMWLFRDHQERVTTKAVNIYRGEFRDFAYITPRIRLTPRDLINTHLENPTYLHFICSPKRAKEILSEIDEIDGWTPQCIFEPIPDRCVPEELPALQVIIHRIYILSPNAEEALSLLSMCLPPTKVEIERAADMLLSFGARTIIIRSGALGAYVKVSGKETGTWIPAFFSGADSARVVDVTGAGNAFLGGLAAGLSLTNGDVVSASLYATLSAAYTIEQKGLPKLTRDGSIELWNNDRPSDRLQQLKSRLSRDTDVL